VEQSESVKFTIQIYVGAHCSLFCGLQQDSNPVIHTYEYGLSPIPIIYSRMRRSSPTTALPFLRVVGFHSFVFCRIGPETSLMSSLQTKKGCTCKCGANLRFSMPSTCFKLSILSIDQYSIFSIEWKQKRLKNINEFLDAGYITWPPKEQRKTMKPW